MEYVADAAELGGEVTEADDTTEVEPTEAELETIEGEGEATIEPTEEKRERSRRRGREPVAVAWRANSQSID